MGAYLDRLNEQFDEIHDGIDKLVDRAAEEKRDVTDDEAKQVARDQARLTELETAISHYSGLEKQSAKVAVLRASVPTPSPRATTTTQVTEPEYDIAREFPTVGDYAVTVHRATMLKDPAAREQLDRATAHQKLADNPGLIPRPILGPVLNDIDASRPFVNSCNRKSLPAGAFDRPVVTQHVAVAKQAAEKDLTASQVMKIGKLPVAAATFAGHLNISRQDIKWTSPGILNIVFDDFGAIYAQTTCDDACDQFILSIAASPSSPVEGTGTAGAVTGGDVTAALYNAVAASLATSPSLPDTLWCAPDVWGSLGGMSNPMGAQAFPSLSLTNTGGNPMGLRLVVDTHFPAGTAVIGPSRYLEFYEDVDGLMQVGEPDVLGQLVGYAGYTAFVNVLPTVFSKITGLPPVVVP